MSRHQTDQVPPRWLIVVQHDKPDIYASLCYGFELDNGVQVVLDRRRVDRRESGTLERWRPGKAERRRHQRRRPPPTAEAAFARHAGFFLIVRDQEERGRSVPVLEGPPTLANA